MPSAPAEIGIIARPPGETQDEATQGLASLLRTFEGPQVVLMVKPPGWYHNDLQMMIVPRLLRVSHLHSGPTIPRRS